MLTFGTATSLARSSASDGNTVKVALIEDVTGGFAAISGPQPSQAFIKDVNAHGGLKGGYTQAAIDVIAS